MGKASSEQTVWYAADAPPGASTTGERQERDGQSPGAPARPARAPEQVGPPARRPRAALAQSLRRSPGLRQANAAARVPRLARRLLARRARSRSSVFSQQVEDGYKAQAFTTSVSAVSLPAHVINLADVPSYIAEELRQFDANNDGLITVEEVLKKGAEIAHLNYKVRARRAAALSQPAGPPTDPASPARAAHREMRRRRGNTVPALGADSVFPYLRPGATASCS